MRAVEEVERYGVSTVERALDVLRAFTHRQPELSLTDIAAMTGLHKATVFRLLATLCKGGMTMKNPRTGLYRLGFAVIAMSEVAKTSTGFVTRIAFRVPGWSWKSACSSSCR